jgi:hypothetical protein
MKLNNAQGNAKRLSVYRFIKIMKISGSEILIAGSLARCSMETLKGSILCCTAGTIIIVKSPGAAVKKPWR